MRIYINQGRTLGAFRRFSPSHTARYRDGRRLLGHLIGFVAVLLGILWVLAEFGGG